MFARKRHLDDSALIRRYLADRGLAALEANDETLLRHLVQCAACESRYVALQNAFDEARQAAVDEASAVCSSDRMERQRERILRRIEAQYAGPRVLPFPAAGPYGQSSPQIRLPRRWVAVAAAAGLVVGLTAGRLIFVGGTQPVTEASRQIAPASTLEPARPAPVMRPVHAEPALNEDQFLSELELATAAPRTQELRAIYAFTLEESRDLPRAVKKD